MTALDVVALVLGILLLVVALFALIMVPVSRRAKRLRASMEEELGGSARRIENVQGLGLESRGKGQVRGNGWLVLSEDELVFRMWVPARETRIPLAAMTDVGTEKAWLGKWVGARLLRVRWRAEDGTEDAMAWRVRDLDEWLGELGATAVGEE